MAPAPLSWTSDTLLAATIHDLQRRQAKDGIRRVFTYDADQVGVGVPAYAAYVNAEVERLGRGHPLIKSKNYLEEVDAEGGLVPEHRRALMRGGHLRSHRPETVSEASRSVSVVDKGRRDPSQCY